MIVHPVFAQICDEEVTNIIVCDNYELANWLTKASYGNEAFAIDCLQYSCGIGDKYHDGSFYRINEDGVEEVIPYTPTAEQEVPSLSAQITYISMMSDIELEEVKYE